MIAPDFSKYALALIHEGAVVYSSTNQGLAPLVECIETCASRYRDCLLHDRVIGLAAAKLVVASGMIRSIVAGVSSQPAVEFLKERRIPMEARSIVPRIIARDGVSICPMEQRAMAREDPDIFFNELRDFFRGLKEKS
jgi:Domain of unknown function (DUF1893)